MIVIVALVGAYRQNGYGNVRVREALIIGALSPLGVLVGVAVANHVSERALQLSFAALALFMAAQLVRRARACLERDLPGELPWSTLKAWIRSPGKATCRTCARRSWSAPFAAGTTPPRPPRPRSAAIATSLDAELIATVDPEDYFDFQSTRPTISLDEGQTRRIDWPENNLDRGPGPERRPRPRPARRDRAEPALAHLLGDDRDRRRRARGRDGDHPRRPDRRGLPHPAGADHRPRLRAASWSRSSNSSAPTTRARPGSSASSTTSAARPGSTPPRSGRRCPHYVAAVPNPKAALALLRRLEGLTGIAVEASELEEETTDYEEQIGRAVAANPEIEELVSRIEAEQVDLLDEEGEELPSADTIAREFQRFLRQRGDQRLRAASSTGSAARLRLSGRRADQAVVAPAADAGGGARLEVLAEDALADLEDGALDPLGVVGLGRRRDLVGVEHVVVAAGAGLDLPGLAGRQPVERQLQVVLELGLGLALAGLVVDQLVVAVGQAVDAVDAAADVVVADLEVELFLQPDRFALGDPLALPVEPQRLAGAVAELQLVVGRAEAGPPPAGLEEAVQHAAARPRRSPAAPCGSARGRCGRGSRSAG